MLSLLLESSVRATLLISAIALVLWVLRIRTAWVRHAAWASVVAGMLALPALVALGPQVSFALLPEQAPAFAPPPVVLEMTGDAEPLRTKAATTVPEAGPRWSWQQYAFCVYLLGVGFFLTRLAVGTLQVRRLLSSAEIDQGKLVHKGCSTPITVGCFRPTVILPSDWREWPEAQLAAVLAHEAEHVRRRDPLYQWLALLNRAIFWFHPLAWWLEQRLSGLAEETCDAAVLRQGHDPADYSRYLLAMARSAQQSGARVHAIGMAMPGVGLRERVHAILDGVRCAPVSRVRLACITASIAVLGAFLTTGHLAHAQQPLPKYEVATVKPAAPGTEARYIRFGDAGRISIVNMPLKALIEQAYGPTQVPVAGGPKWIYSLNEGFTIEAKGPAIATPTTHRLMLRRLLAERFALKVHTEHRERPAYALTLVRSDGKLGAGAVKTAGNECVDGRMTQADPSMPRCGASISPRGMSLKSATMRHLAFMLSLPSSDVGRSVVDRTGVTGEFDLNLEFAVRTDSKGGTPPSEIPGPSIFTALREQLGLKLENARASIEALVVDSAEKPGEN